MILWLCKHTHYAFMSVWTPVHALSLHIKVHVHSHKSIKIHVHSHKSIKIHEHSYKACMWVNPCMHATKVSFWIWVRINQPNTHILNLSLEKPTEHTHSESVSGETNRTHTFWIWVWRNQPNIHILNLTHRYTYTRWNHWCMIHVYKVNLKKNYFTTTAFVYAHICIYNACIHV